MPVMATTPHALLADAAAVAAGGERAVGEGAALRVGVDLGTASCVLVVLDGDRPVWVGAQPAAASGSRYTDSTGPRISRESGTSRPTRSRRAASTRVRVGTVKPDSSASFTALCPTASGRRAPRSSNSTRTSAACCGAFIQ